MTDRGVGATETSIAVLETLCRLGTAGVTEIAREIDASKASVHEHLTTLRDARFVRQVDGEYRPSHRPVALAAAAKRTWPVYTEGRIHVAELAERTGAAATLTVPEAGYDVCLHADVAAGGPEGAPTEGRRVPLSRTAAGLAILSRYSPDRRRTALSDHPATATDPADRLDRIAQRGTAARDAGDGLREIAAPVAADGDDPVGAIALWRSTEGDGGTRVEADLRKLVRSTAANVSNRLTLSD